jgi:hypothetical protein
MKASFRNGLILVCVAAIGAFFLMRHKFPSGFDSASSAFSSFDGAVLNQSPLPGGGGSKGGVPSEAKAGAKSSVPALSSEVGQKKSLMLPPPVLPEGPVVNYIYDLIAKAENGKAPDADAAYIAFEAIKRCGTYPYRSSDTEAMNKKVPKECDGLAPELQQRAIELLKRAAEMGHVRAQLEYANGKYAIFNLDEMGLIARAEEVVAFKRDALQFLTSAANMGSANALQSLSYAYEDGYLAAKNPVLAYAYQHALLRTVGNPYLSREVARLGEQLSPQQTTQAQTLGDQIFSQCCLKNR